MRALAREHGLDLSTLTGTGPGGRVLKGDVLAALQQAAPIGGKAPSPAPSTTPLQSNSAAAVGHYSQPPSSTVVPLKGYRRAMVSAMEASNAVPHFHLCDEVDLTQLAAVRQRLRGDAMLNGQRLTFLPFVIKVCWMMMSLGHM